MYSKYFARICITIFIAADVALAQRSRRNNERTAEPKLTIPAVDELERIGPNMRPSREAMRNTAFIMKTGKHEVIGDKYIILTDHTAPQFVKQLERLAKHRHGMIIQTDDLALLHKNADKMERLRKQLIKARVRYIAMAPRMETYRENMLLGMWELISTLDSDPQLDAFPGFLLASDEKSFAALIDRSINHKPQGAKNFQPFAINQVPSRQELRSLQKSGVLRKMFAEYGYKTPTLAIYSEKAKGAPELPGDQFWKVDVERRDGFMKKLPPAAAKAFDKASLLVMHGHGIPGMSCGVDIDALPKDLSAEVVLCGSCFSAAPRKSDLPAMREAPGGYEVETRDAFALRAVDNGATVVFGHMRLNQGFPHLFPVLEAWMKGRTVGEAYQELINAIIEKNQVKSGGFTVKEDPGNARQIPQNVLLYVIIGDPALQPLVKMSQH